MNDLFRELSFVAYMVEIGRFKLGLGLTGQQLADILYQETAYKINGFLQGGRVIFNNKNMIIHNGIPCWTSIKSAAERIAEVEQ